MHPFVPLLLLTAVQPHAADGDETLLSAEFGRCMDSGEAARGVHPAMMDCLRAEYRRQDLRLNRSYAAAMRRLRPAAQARLRTLQRAWLGTRDRACQAAFEESGGGQASDLAYSSCRAEQTARRTRWLQRYR
jgi:uncharacterized protein YecT (DUF1311 family)